MALVLTDFDNSYRAQEDGVTNKGKSMKVPLYVIAAHHRPDRLEDLVSALAPHKVMIHIDRKVDSAAFKAALALPNALAIPNEVRVAVSWAGWSQVQATLRLLESVQDLLPTASHVVFLSGDTFPLADSTALARYFAKHATTQFINTIRIPSVEASKPITRLSRFYVEYDRNNGRKNLLPRAFNKLGMPRRYRHVFREIVPYAGSSWWALTADAVKYVLAESRRSADLQRFCRNAKMPDEFYFQTLIMNSQFSSHVRPSLMFTEWKPGAGNPEPLNEKHVDVLLKENCVNVGVYGRGDVRFARKVLDRAVAERIRSHLWLGSNLE